MSTPVFRFAPSPNGRLHLGHAASALLNARLAAEAGGRFLLRIEDIDVMRCRPEFEEAVFHDLDWLGLAWEKPVLRQSEHFPRYGAALDRLYGRGLLYPCFCSRKQIAADGAGLGADPDGAPLYSGRCRGIPAAESARRIAAGEPHALRMDVAKALALVAAPLSWREGPPGAAPAIVPADPARWGDAVLKRKEFPSSYHVSVVVDDALQGVTHVVRGRDLLESTALHRLLQALLGLPEPLYLHHRLILAEDGAKLSKSRSSPALADLRAAGATPDAVRRMAAI
ncbi:MAG: tRNA glutamyl-Q(34) synthetase GluQRS [Beijerinckiaceae bacterium]